MATSEKGGRRERKERWGDGEEMGTMEHSTQHTKRIAPVCVVPWCPKRKGVYHILHHPLSLLLLLLPLLLLPVKLANQEAACWPTSLLLLSTTSQHPHDHPWQDEVAAQQQRTEEHNRSTTVQRTSAQHTAAKSTAAQKTTGSCFHVVRRCGLATAPIGQSNMVPLCY